MSKRWTEHDIPDLSGKLAVVTGANSGLGLATARGLAGAGAEVIMACRNLEKARATADAIRKTHSRAKLDLMALDLSDLSAVRAFASAFNDKYDRLDILVNNAGVMALPERRTADGFEMQVGTNHLGHFTLTGLLLDRLRAGKAPRVVTVSSFFHKRGRIRLDDLNWNKGGYDKWKAYAQAKLANLMFTLELDRRLKANNETIISAGSHPGYAATHLQFAGPEMSGSVLNKLAMHAGNMLLAQSQDKGALPSLYAATAPDVQGGAYYGPDGIGEMRGYPTRAQPVGRARDTDTAARLWSLSERLTGVRYLSDKQGDPD
jgi:protochlorophyllide reductase